VSNALPLDGRPPPQYRLKMEFFTGDWIARWPNTKL